MTSQEQQRKRAEIIARTITPTLMLALDATDAAASAWAAFNAGQELGARLQRLRASHDRLLEAARLIAAGPVDEPQIDLVGDYQKGLFCGLEDVGLQGDGHKACLHGFEAGVERVLEWAQGIVHDAIAQAEEVTG